MDGSCPSLKVETWVDEERVASPGRCCGQKLDISLQAEQDVCRRDRGDEFDW